MQNNEAVIAVGMPEAARRLGLSLRTVAMLVLRHELQSRKVGRRRIIPVAALEAFVRGEPRSANTKQVQRVQGDSGRPGE